MFLNIPTSTTSRFTTIFLSSKQLSGMMDKVITIKKLMIKVIKNRSDPTKNAIAAIQDSKISSYPTHYCFHVGSKKCELLKDINALGKTRYCVGFIFLNIHTNFNILLIKCFSVILKHKCLLIGKEYSQNEFSLELQGEN
jgi:hypothetical protein